MRITPPCPFTCLTDNLELLGAGRKHIPEICHNQRVHLMNERLRFEMGLHLGLEVESLYMIHALFKRTKMHLS